MIINAGLALYPGSVFPLLFFLATATKKGHPHHSLITEKAQS